MKSKKFRVLITGQNKGLGKSLSNKFISEGHYVMHHGGSTHVDLSNTKDLISFSEMAKDNGINVLVNNAAIVCPNIEFEKYSIHKIKNMIDVNLIAPIILSRILVNQL